ncbi:MAG: hypothetical protein U9R34_04215 [Nanoarchaeota archaeon]|nr:hypothetical protein [Nanoarchaeota archaeon]
MAGLLFLFVLGMMFFKLIKDMGDSAPGAGAFAFLLIFFSMTAIVPSFYSWIIQKVPFLEALLSIGVILAVFIAVKEMFGLITGGGGAKADGDMGLSDSQEYLKKKEKKKREIVEKGVERLRQEADEVREKAAVAKTPEEKKAYKKKADDNRAKADEKLEDELTSRGSIGGIPVRSRLSSAELIKRRKEYLKRLEDLEKEKLEEIETIKKELIEFQEKLEQMNLRNYEDLSDGNKEIYIDIGRNIQNKLLKLVNTLFKLEKCEIKDLEFLKKLRYNVDTRQISRFYLNIIGNEEMIKKEYNLVMLVKRFSEKIVKIMEEQNKIPHLPGLISRIIQVVDKLKEINEESLSRL